MPYETPVCHPQSFEAPPCARREPLQKPVTKFNGSLIYVRSSTSLEHKLANKESFLLSLQLDE